jgi:hypothetical protein
MRRRREPEEEERNVRQRTNRLPTYTSEVQYGQSGLPKAVVVRPITTPESDNETALSRHLAGVIRQRVQAAVQQYTNWSTYRTNGNTRGVLVGTNLDDEQTSTAIHVNRLSSLTGKRIFDEFANIHQSNRELRISDVEWTFHIDIGSFFEGGGRVVKPKWAAGFAKTWIDNGVNCAAYALAYAVADQRKRDTKTLVKIDAVAMCLRYQWGDTCTLEELKKFVDEFTEYKLVAFDPLAGMKVVVWEGKDYEFDGSEKIIYLGISMNHYGLVKSPEKAANKCPGFTNHKWCHKCCILHSKDRSHDCENPDAEGEHLKMITCERCGVKVHSRSKNSHRCDEMQCKLCSAYIKKGGKNGVVGYTHRCPIMSQPWSEKQKYWSDKLYADMDGKLQALWAYDFESCLELEPSVIQLIDEFEKDENDQFTGKVLLYTNMAKKHKVNYIACRNVITNECFSFFGSKCLEEFIKFGLHANKGNNCFFAHNASGYDGRFCFIDSDCFMMRLSTIAISWKFPQCVAEQNLFKSKLVRIWYIEIRCCICLEVLLIMQRVFVLMCILKKECFLICLTRNKTMITKALFLAWSILIPLFVKVKKKETSCWSIINLGMEELIGISRTS